MKIVEDILSQSTSEIMQIALEYSKLATLPELSEKQARHIGEILALANNCEVLNFWIAEVDHCLGHELGLLDDAARYSYSNQQAFLREYLGHEISPYLIREYLKSIRNQSQKKTAANC